MNAKDYIDAYEEQSKSRKKNTTKTSGFNQKTKTYQTSTYTNPKTTVTTTKPTYSSKNTSTVKSNVQNASYKKNNYNTGSNLADTVRSSIDNTWKAQPEKKRTASDRAYVNTGNKAQDALVNSVKKVSNVMDEMGAGANASMKGYTDAAANFDKWLNNQKAVQNLYKAVGSDVSNNKWADTLQNGRVYNTQKQAISDFQNANPENTTFTGGVAESIGGMIPSITAGLIAGGIGSAAGLGSTVAGTATSNLAKGASLATMGTSVFGNASQSALDRGYDINKAAGYGLGKATIEVGTELLSPGVPGVQSMTLKNILGEGAEGIVGQYLDPFADVILEDNSNGKLGSNILDASKKAISAENTKEALKEGALGSVTAGLMQGATHPIETVNNIVSDTQNTINNVKGTNEYENFVSQTNENIKQKQAEIESAKKQIEKNKSYAGVYEAEQENANLNNQIAQNESDIKALNDYKKATALEYAKSDYLKSDNPLLRNTAKAANADLIKMSADEIGYKGNVDDIISASNSTNTPIEFSDQIQGDGMELNGKVYVNSNSDNAVNTILSHEFAHVAETSSGYKQYTENLQKLQKQGVLNVTDAELHDISENAKANGADADHEITARLTEALFENTDAVKTISKYNPTILGKLVQSAKSAVNYLKGDTTNNQITKVQNMLADAMTNTDSTVQKEAEFKNKKEKSVDDVYLDQLLEDSFSDGMSIGEIADKYNIPQSDIENWIANKNDSSNVMPTAKTKTVKAKTVKAEPVTTEIKAEPETVKAEPVKAETAKAETAKAETVEPAKAETAEPERYKNGNINYNKEAEKIAKKIEDTQVKQDRRNKTYDDALNDKMGKTSKESAKDAKKKGNDRFYNPDSRIMNDSIEDAYDNYVKQYKGDAIIQMAKGYLASNLASKGKQKGLQNIINEQELQTGIFIGNKITDALEDMRAGNASNEDINELQDIFNDVAVKVNEIGHNAGYTLQMMAQLRRNTPSGRISTLNSMLKKINEKLVKKGKDPIKIDENLTAEYLKAGTEEERTKIMDDIFKDIGSKYPTSIMEDIDQLRYLNMLFNPTTHIRNLVGNTLFQGVVTTKNIVKRFVELAVPKDQRTTAHLSRSDKALMDYARESFAKDINVSDGNKYETSNQIDKYRQNFKRLGILGKGIDKVSKFNSKMLDLEDQGFTKFRYTRTLAQYMKAQNVTVNENGELIKDGKTLSAKEEAKMKGFAYQEALESVFRDASKLADAINNSANTNLATHIGMSAVMPFTKTPINIGRRAIEYSPLGVATTLAKGLADIKSGNIDGTTFVNKLSKGISGSGLAYLGYFLASVGWLRGKDDDKDKVNRFEESIGEDDYAVVLPDGSTYSVDWAAPTISGVLIGAIIYDITNEGLAGNTDDSFKKGLQIISATLDPILQTTYMSSLQSTLASLGSNNTDDQTNALLNFFLSTVGSYIGQFTPTLGKKINNIIDPTVRSTYSADSLDKYIRQTKAKIIGMSTELEPKLDYKGNEVQQVGDNVWERAAYNLLSPGVYRKNTKDETDSAILKLSKDTGETGFIPQSYTYVYNDTEQYTFTPKESTEFNKYYSKALRNSESDFANSSLYATMNDDEKVEMMNQLQRNAMNSAKYEYFQKIGVEFENKDLEYQKKAENWGMSAYQYYDVKNTESDKDADGNTVSNTRALKARAKLEALGYYDDVVQAYENDEIDSSALSSYYGLNKTVLKMSSRKYESEYADMLDGELALESEAKTAKKKAKEDSDSSDTSDEEKEKAENLDKFFKAVMKQSLKGNGSDIVSTLSDIKSYDESLYNEIVNNHKSELKKLDVKL